MTNHQINPDLQNLATPITELKPLPGNPRKGDIQAVANSYKRFGQRKPIVALPDGTVIAGNHQLAAAKQLGWTHIAVTRVDDDDATAKAFALADNRTADLGDYDNDAIADFIEAVAAADPELVLDAGYTPDDVAAILEEAGRNEDPDPDGGDAEDDAPNIPENPVSKTGDVWLLGEHRLMCGSAVHTEDLDRLVNGLDVGIVYTDPPYGINAVNAEGKTGGAAPAGGKAKNPHGKVIKAKTYIPVAGDDTTDVARDSFALLIQTYPRAAHVWWGGNHYAGSAKLPDASCWIVWDKETGDNHFADAELAWTNNPGAVRIFRHMWNGMIRASEKSQARIHPTQKPVALAEWCFSIVDKTACRKVVLDVFGGSGSTLMAAHNSGRVACVMEMEAGYIDLICRRYQKLTGTVPVLEATGEPHDFTAVTDGT